MDRFIQRCSFEPQYGDTVYHKLRELVAAKLAEESPFVAGEIEVDELFRRPSQRQAQAWCHRQGAGVWPAQAQGSCGDAPSGKGGVATQSAMIGRLYEIRAQTVDGAAMRLRAAVAFCPELMRLGTGTLSEILMTAAIRDLTREEAQ